MGVKIAHQRGNILPTSPDLLDLAQTIDHVVHYLVLVKPAPLETAPKGNNFRTTDSDPERRVKPGDSIPVHKNGLFRRKDRIDAEEIIFSH